MSQLPKLDEGASSKKLNPFDLPLPAKMFGVDYASAEVHAAMAVAHKTPDGKVHFDLEADPAEVIAALYGKAFGGKSVFLEAAKQWAEASLAMDGLKEVLDTVPGLPKPDKAWEAKLPQERPQEMRGFRTERRAASAKARRKAKAARKQRRRCR